MDARTICDALGGKKCGDGYIMRCVAHDDKSPSLSVSDGRNGEPVVFCHAGCDFLEIVSELKAMGLWAEYSASPHEKAHRAKADDIHKLEHEILVISQPLNVRLYEPDKEKARQYLKQVSDREKLAAKRIIKLLGDIYG